MTKLLAYSLCAWLSNGALQTPYLWQDMDEIYQSGNTIGSANSGDVTYNTANYPTEAGVAQDGSTVVGVFQCDLTIKHFEAFMGEIAAFSYDGGYSIEVVAKIQSLDTVFPGFLVGIMDSTDNTARNVITFNEMTSQPHSSGEPANKFFADNQAGGGWQADTTYWTDVAATTDLSAADTWYHIIVSQDASVTPNVVRVFVNGALYGVSYQAITAKTAGAQQPSLYLCGFRDGAATTTAGINAQIRGFGFYTMAITAEADAFDTCSARAMSADCNGLSATADPTANPSGSPSSTPSVSPTKNPTNNPSVSPTKNPTVTPTVSPTNNPSVSPTKNPTSNPTVSPTKNPTSNPSVSPTKNPTGNPSVTPSVSPTASPVDINTVACVFGSNYNFEGTPAQVTGDPHFLLWNQDNHDFMGAKSMNPNDVYYYMHPCKFTNTRDMPFALAGHHWQSDSSSAQSVSYLDYVVLHLFDSSGEEYYVWLSGTSSGLHHYAMVDAQTDAVYDLNSNQATYTALSSGVTASIGTDFKVTYTETTTSRIDVVLSIYACDVEFNLDAYMVSRLLSNGRYRGHALQITPPACYKCHTCGLLGSFKKSRAAHTLKTCGGGNFAYTAGWSQSNVAAWDQDAWTWRKGFVDATAACARTWRRRILSESSRRNLLAVTGCDPVTDDLCYVPNAPLNLVYNELCDATVQPLVETACQTARDNNAASCTNLGPLFCDQLQAQCDYDACVAVGTDTTLIDSTVATFFDKVVTLTTAIPAANWAYTNLGSVFTDTNTVDCILGHNYNFQGVVCSASGDPHFVTWAGDTHHCQGSNNLYYYMYPCANHARQDMPFDIAGYHYTHGGSATSVSTLYYALLVLYDTDAVAAGATTDKYYVWINPAFQKYSISTSAANGMLYDSSATSLVSGVQTSIGNRFEITVTTSYRRVDVVLNIFECELSFYMSGSGVGHAIYITPPACYRCHTCGLCGNFIWPTTDTTNRYAHNLPLCTGGRRFYRHEWLMWGTRYPEAHDANGWSWGVDYVASTTTCARPETNRRRLAADVRRLQDDGGYTVDIPADFNASYVDPCDDAIFAQTQTACQTARDRNTACCATVGSDKCDEFQTACEYDACVEVGSDASLIDATVLELFDEAIAVLCDIPDVGTLLDPANTVVVAGAEPTSEPTDEPTAQPTSEGMDSTIMTSSTEIVDATETTEVDTDESLAAARYVGVVYAVAMMGMVFVVRI
jgi:hypothetical protein